MPFKKKNSSTTPVEVSTVDNTGNIVTKDNLKHVLSKMSSDIKSKCDKVESAPGLVNPEVQKFNEKLKSTASYVKYVMHGLEEHGEKFVVQSAMDDYIAMLNGVLDPFEKLKQEVAEKYIEPIFIAAINDIVENWDSL